METPDNTCFRRWMAPVLAKKLARPYVHILFGARQTGKSTLLKSLLPEKRLEFNFADPQERNRHLARPDLFAAACRALPAPRGGSPAVVFVDEAQNVPAIFDAVQTLFDENKARWRFVLCGSSARKLRKTGANLLPGRCFLHRLFPLVTAEQPPATPVEKQPPASAILPLPEQDKTAAANNAADANAAFPAWPIEERLAYGALPGIVLAEEEDRPDLLRAYASVFLEEEIRREALVKDWGAFLRFLTLAASESGQIVNYSTISREAGLSVNTVKSYYQLLEDMFIGFSIPAFSGSARKNLLSTPRFCFFDLGVRNATAGLTPGMDIVGALAGPLFEQWVGIELWKRLQYIGSGRLSYLRTHDGMEIDYIVEQGKQWTPVEVKWTDKPTPLDAKHLITFLAEHPGRAQKGYVVCRTPRPVQLAKNITAIPWAEM